MNYDASLRKHNYSTPSMTGLGTVAKDSVSIGDSVKNGTVKAFNWVDKKGFLVDFLIIDALSMIIPRILVGLSRDREKTGKLNYKAGAEEAGREITSGPSMMVIPMGILAIANHFSPASQMKKATLESLTEGMNSVVDNTDSKLLTNHEHLNKTLSNKLFDDAFKDFDLENREGYKSKFTEFLNDSTKLENKMFKNKEFRAKSGEFEKLIVEINNANRAAVPSDTKVLSLSKGGVSAIDLFEDFSSYSKDVVAKFSKKDFGAQAAETAKTEAKSFLEKIKNVRSLTKLATAATAFLAVGGFLLYLPKLYQQGKVSPAMESAKRAGASEGGANENK